MINRSSYMSSSQNNFKPNANSKHNKVIGPVTDNLEQKSRAELTGIWVCFLQYLWWRLLREGSSVYDTKSSFSQLLPQHKIILHNTMSCQFLKIKSTTSSCSTREEFASPSWRSAWKASRWRQAQTCRRTQEPRRGWPRGRTVPREPRPPQGP